EKGRFPTGFPIYSFAETLSNQKVVIGGQGGTIFFLNPDATLFNSYKTAPTVGNPATLPNGDVVIGADQGKLLRFDETGKFKNAFESHSVYIGSPIAQQDGSVIFGTKNAAIQKLNPNGKLEWTFKTGGTYGGNPTTLKDGTVVAGSNDNILHFINQN